MDAALEEVAFLMSRNHHSATGAQWQTVRTDSGWLTRLCTPDEVETLEVWQWAEGWEDEMESMVDDSELFERDLFISLPVEVVQMIASVSTDDVFFGVHGWNTRAVR
jgi:hypothetical protein